MNTKSYFIILLSVVFFQCGRQEREELQTRINELEANEQRLQRQTQESEASLKALTESLVDVEKNLREIRARELNIQLSQQESDLSPEDLGVLISQNINVVDSLIRQNKQIIRNLSARLRSLQQEKGQLSSTTEQLKEDLEEQISAREQNIAMLKAQLQREQSIAKALQMDVDSLSRLNEEKTNALNTAYYVVGDFKALRDEQILDRKGGFLGIGGIKLLRDDFDPNKFSRIDIREMAQFPAKGKEITLVTVHPPGSYQIDKEASGEQVNLIVSDPDKFWESSKYLVMLVN